ncbi:MAG: efflux transporter periplasmic adaptor subunit [Bacteroidetes bacterium GWD2_45_23]|nr:MAG: efflux transporter periplasmic adaptor subunit [Bacteroidetes bacterium GWC2_46_850]OFX86150.1 MAG: efflux transporter periplasmic adaptor subunit [Bacteroidetes bacterium GWD2_45_23]HCC17281.1 efflux transporter periplasmic adaptor subunit [Porphyromonadaceae bacterium]
MTKKSKIIVIGSIALLILGMAFFPRIKQLLASDDSDGASIKRTPAEGTGRSELVVNATILQPQTLNNLFRITGVLLPDEEVDLTFESSGKITHIYFQEGTYVQQGTLLAKVNDAPLQAELKKLEAQLPLAEDRLFRQQTLLEKDAISQETYQSVFTQLETLKADIELVKTRIRQTELRAPFGGMIGLRQVSEGAYASPNVVVANLTKISPLKVEFSLTQNFVNRIKPGTEIAFTVENDLEVYNASVYAVESRLDVQTLSLFARARYANTDGRIKPGQSASIRIKLDQIDNAIVIPGISTVKEMGRDITYVYENGKAKEVEITTGMRTSSSVEVVSGLTVGDTLLTTGVMQLRSGMPVRIDRMVPNSAD